MFYLIIWFLALALSVSGVCGLRQPKESTILLLLAHIFTFVLGYSIVKVFDCKTDIVSMHRTFDSQINALQSSKIFRGILCIALLYVSSMFVRFYQEVMVANALVDVRNDFYSGELLGQGFSFVNTYFLIPFQGFILGVFGYMTFFKRNWVWLLLGAYIIMYSLLSAGRNEFANILLILVFFALCVKRLSSINSFRNYSVFAILILCAYLTMGFLTGNRSDNSGHLKDTLVEGIKETNIHIMAYLGGPVVAFDYALNSNLREECGGFQYGVMTFASVDEIIFVVEVILNKVMGGGTRQRAISEVGTYLHDNYIDVGTPWRWNALYTSCMYYYLDFGTIGVLLLPFIWGILVRLSIRWLYKYRSFLFLILLSIVFYTLINSFQRFFLYRMSQLLLLIGLYYFARKNTNFPHYLENK